MWKGLDINRESATFLGCCEFERFVYAKKQLKKGCDEKNERFIFGFMPISDC